MRGFGTRICSETIACIVREETRRNARGGVTMETVRIDVHGPVWAVTLNRPDVRNAVDGPTARALAQAFRAFDADADARVAVLTGVGGTFCAGADLTAVAEGGERMNPLEDDLDADGPMGPTRLQLAKPVIAAVSGHAVAGGMELALWCDLRVVDDTAVFGVFCRRWGVPLIDGGTVRLPRLIGESRALDLILTGRAVDADEALGMGLANRRAAPGQTALDAALELARQLAALPPTCLRSDLASVKSQAGLPLRDALAHEFALGLATLESGESRAGAGRFVGGAGRHGRPA
jgi:enoyl-CoA hydratase